MYCKQELKKQGENYSFSVILLSIQTWNILSSENNLVFMPPTSSDGEGAGKTGRTNCVVLVNNVDI